MARVWQFLLVLMIAESNVTMSIVAQSQDEFEHISSVSGLKHEIRIKSPSKI